jgi:hypothetical protein
MESTSGKFELNTTDMKKIFKGALLAFGGAVLVQISTYLSTGVVFDWKIWLTGAVAVGLNAVYKFIQDNQ